MIVQYLSINLNILEKSEQPDVKFDPFCWVIQVL